MKTLNIKNFTTMVALDVNSITDREWQSLFAACVKFDALKGLVTDLIDKKIKIDPLFCNDIKYLLFSEDIDYTISKEIEDLDPIDLEDVESTGEFSYELEISDLDIKLFVKEVLEIDDDEKVWIPKEVKLEIL